MELTDLTVGEVFIDKEGYGCGYDETCYEYKYQIIAINLEKSKVKIQKIGARTTVMWGKDIDSEFNSFKEKPFWASANKFDEKTISLYNGSRHFCHLM